MKEKNSIEIRLLTIPWCTYSTRSFKLTNIGTFSSYPVDKDVVLFVGKATKNDSQGHLVFNVVQDIYCFWPESGGNIDEYLKMKEKSYSWREDIALLQGKKEEFTLKIGMNG